MKNISFIPCTTDFQLHQVADLATIIWHEYFPCIISDDQIDYMVEKFQSYPAMKQQIEKENYMYIQVRLGDQLVGYLGLADQEDTLFISKFYLEKSARGKGVANAMFQYCLNTAKQQEKKKCRLTCNKYNSHSLEVYKHWGFQIVESAVFDIGKGYVMDDYILEYEC